MDQAQIPTLLGLALQTVIVLFVMLSYFRRFATKDDIKDLSDKLTSVEARLGQVEAGQAALETRMGALETRQDALETRMGALETRQGALETRMGALETRMGALETRQDALETRMGALETKQDALETRMGALETRMGQVETRLGQVETRQDGLETRFDTLEGFVRDIGRKADASLDLHHTVRGDLKVLQASVNRLESYFETPKLKTS